MLLETVRWSVWPVAGQAWVVFAHRFVVTVFSVLVFWRWNKKVDGCMVPGAATLERRCGVRTMASAMTMRGTAFDPELPRIPGV